MKAVKAGDTVVAIRPTQLSDVPKPNLTDKGSMTRRLKYAPDVEAGIVMYANGTAVVYRQVGSDRVEVPAPDYGTGIALLLVVHHEFKVGMFKGLSFEQADEELRDTFLSFGPRLKSFTEPPAADLHSLIDWRTGAPRMK